MLKVRLILIFCCLGTHFLWAQKTDFAVEVAAFAEQVPLSYFNKLKNVYETVDANYIYRYYIDVKDKNQAETLKQRLGTITLLQASDAKREKADADALAKLKAAASETPKNTTACLPLAATRRVRAIK